MLNERVNLGVDELENLGGTSSVEVFEGKARGLLVDLTMRGGRFRSAMSRLHDLGPVIDTSREIS